MGLRTSIFDGVVVHSRLIPKEHSFKYKVFSILFNIDDLKNFSNKYIFFSYNRFNLFSFFDKDHGEKDGSNPREWILKIAKNQNIDCDNLRIFVYVILVFLVTFLILLASGLFIMKNI